MADSMTSPGLIKAVNEALIAAGKDITMAKYFTHNFSEEAGEWGLTYKIPVVDGSGISAFNINSNDYENQNGTVTYATISCNYQPKCTFEFKGTDILEAPNAPYWQTVAEGAAEAISHSIGEAIVKELSGTSFTAATHTLLSAGNTLKSYTQLRADAQGRTSDTVLALNPEFYSELVSLLPYNIFGNRDPIADGYIGKALGFKAVVCLNELNKTNVGGYIIPASAMAVISKKVPVGDASVYSEYGTVTDENGFTLTVMRHGSAAKGKGFINVTALLGVGLVQTSKIRQITRA